MSERSGTSLFNLAIWGALGYAGYALYKNAKQKLPEGATPADILREMNPLSTLVAAGSVVKDGARDVASTVKDAAQDVSSAAGSAVRDAAQMAKDKFVSPNHR